MPTPADPISSLPEIAKYLSIFGDKMTSTASIYLIHDSTGRVIKILNAPNDSLSFIVKEILKDGLDRFYDFSLLSKELPENDLKQKQNFFHDPYFYSLYTSLPPSHLRTRSIKEGLFVGRIAFYDFVPNIVSPHIKDFLYVDGKTDKLLGFHQSFYNLFRDIYPRPEAMLGLPLSNLLSPTPRELQKTAVPPFSPGKSEGFDIVYQKDFAKESLGPTEERPIDGGFTPHPDGLLWQCRETNHLFLTPLVELNVLEEDFVATVTFFNVAGQGPYFALGSRYFGEDRLPDDQGYMVGRNVAGDKAVIKRVGLNAATGDTSPLQEGEVTLHLCKIGQVILLFQGLERLTTYFDSRFLLGKKAHLSLGLRRGYACVLKSLVIKVRPSDPPKDQDPPRNNIVKLKHDPQNFYILDRFYNYSLSDAGFLDVEGFFLFDVTDLLDRITSLDQKYKSQVKREEELKTLLKQYELGDQELIGSGEKITVIKETARTVATSTATVLIEGPTGSGKEVLARFIHRHSSRKEGPFVKVDCSTIPKELIESHLFGHEKGAFTGAIARTIGMFEKAHGGTLFLDEVANLGMDTQAKLLQFLNDFSITRIGDSRSIKLNVRCIIASNASLKELVSRGAFREDLYYRVNVVSLRLPSLAERAEDIPELAAFFLKVFSAENQKPIRGFSPDALKTLKRRTWPGNIRELKNVIHRAVIFCSGDWVTEEFLSQAEEEFAPPRQRKSRSRTPYRLALTDRNFIMGILRKHLGSVGHAAEEMGLGRVTLYNHLKKEKIDPSKFRKGFGESAG